MAKFPLPPKVECFYCISGNFNQGSVDLTTSGGGFVGPWMFHNYIKIVECMYMDSYGEESP